MKKKIISPAKVWTSLQEDSRFLEMPAYFRLGFRPFALEAVGILEEVLYQKTTLESVYNAKIYLAEYWMKSGMIDSIEADAPAIDVMFGMVGGETLHKTINRYFKEVLDLKGNMGEWSAGFLKSKRISEEQALIMLGLNGKALKRYRESKLTLGELMMSCPGVVINISPT